MPRASKPAKRARVKPTKRAVHSAPYLEPNDFRRHLLEKSVVIAPGDVESLLALRDEVALKIARDCREHDLLRRQLQLAMQILSDHMSHRSPQIPYHTISVLAAAVLYFMNPVDAIPDFISGIGTSDDALVMELAYELVWPGIDRYCTWKGIPTQDLRAPRKKAR